MSNARVGIVMGSVSDLEVMKGTVEVLKELGIESVAAVGEDFDPEVHEAILQVDQPGSRNGEIVEEIDRGYRCGDQLIRASRVVVARTGETSQGA